MNPEDPSSLDNPGSVNNPWRDLPRSQIADALHVVLEGQLAVYDEKPGYCLRVLRQVVEYGLRLKPGEFYARYRTHTVDDNLDPVRNVWARDVMRSLREQGMRVAYDDNRSLILRELQAGDLIFSWKLGEPQGHCAVVYTGGANALCFENTGSQRGVRVSGFNHLSRVDDLTLHWPHSWEAFRLPGDKDGSVLINPQSYQLGEAGVEVN